MSIADGCQAVHKPGQPAAGTLPAPSSSELVLRFGRNHRTAKAQEWTSSYWRKPTTSAAGAVTPTPAARATSRRTCTPSRSSPRRTPVFFLLGRNLGLPQRVTDKYGLRRYIEDSIRSSVAATGTTTNAAGTCSPPTGVNKSRNSDLRGRCVAHPSLPRDRRSRRIRQPRFPIPPSGTTVSTDRLKRVAIVGTGASAIPDRARDRPIPVPNFSSISAPRRGWSRAPTKSCRCRRAGRYPANRPRATGTVAPRTGPRRRWPTA